MDRTVSSPILATKSIHDANFDEMCTKDRSCFVQFVSPWCGLPCERTTSLLDDLENNATSILVGTIHGPSNDALRKKFNVHHYPALFHVQGQRIFPFDGALSLSAIRVFLRRLSNETVKAVTSLEQLGAEMSERAPDSAAFLLIGEPERHVRDTFEELAQQHANWMSFYSAVDNGTMMQLFLAKLELQGYKNLTDSGAARWLLVADHDDYTRLYRGPLDMEAMEQWMLYYRFPVYAPIEAIPLAELAPLISHTIPQEALEAVPNRTFALVPQRHFLAVSIVIPRERRTAMNHAKAIAKIAHLFPDFRFVWLDAASESPNVQQFLGGVSIPLDMLPTMAVFEPSTGLYWHRDYLSVRNHTHIENLLRAIRDGSEKPAGRVESPLKGLGSAATGDHLQAPTPMHEPPATGSAPERAMFLWGLVALPLALLSSIVLVQTVSRRIKGPSPVAPPKHTRRVVTPSVSGTESTASSESDPTSPPATAEHRGRPRTRAVVRPSSDHQKVN
ncbi:hypothetical protein PAPYR_4348 [Paratrimastix pyriformis]|uniref:Thioredoxin domain-containing protein n=1 Tax=Paratrimastix pyriformis TaxID=342808 RepID=A0ABQ8UK70_9EUKA|nr:hypothetical protein PAPYR_4348 [Paratrimastix pyriformis]